MFKTMAMVAFVALAAGLAGCVAAEDSQSGSAIQAMLGNDFTGNYVKIAGMRSQPADGKYPCLSQFELCLALDKDGVTEAIKNLCPSEDTPAGTRSFRYTLYADKGCIEPLGNLGCVPVEKEFLHCGANYDSVTCITRNADKTFDFCVLDPFTGAGSEACPPCVTSEEPVVACNPN